jgi:hypothetical protein
VRRQHPAAGFRASALALQVTLELVWDVGTRGDLDALSGSRQRDRPRRHDDARELGAQDGQADVSERNRGCSRGDDGCHRVRRQAGVFRPGRMGIGAICVGIGWVSCLSSGSS